MIEEGRMSGEIDQVDEIIRFDQLTPEQIWNNQIKYTCDQINATGGLIFFVWSYYLGFVPRKRW